MATKANKKNDQALMDSREVLRNITRQYMLTVQKQKIGKHFTERLLEVRTKTGEFDSYDISFYVSHAKWSPDDLVRATNWLAARTDSKNTRYDVRGCFVYQNTTGKIVFVVPSMSNPEFASALAKETFIEQVQGASIKLTHLFGSTTSSLPTLLRNNILTKLEMPKVSPSAVDAETIVRDAFQADKKKTEDMRAAIKVCVDAFQSQQLLTEMKNAHNDIASKWNKIANVVVIPYLN